MPVNNFEFEKADAIISSIKGQSVGRDPISAAGIFNFVSIAQKGFGYEPEEEDNIMIIKEKSFDEGVLVFDIKAADLIPAIEQGKFLVIWDGEGRIDYGHPGFWYFGLFTVDGNGDFATVKIFSNAGNVNSSYTTLQPNADGYLYVYLD